MSTQQKEEIELRRRDPEYQPSTRAEYEYLRKSTAWVVVHGRRGEILKEGSYEKVAENLNILRGPDMPAVSAGMVQEYCEDYQVREDAVAHVDDLHAVGAAEMIDWFDPNERVEYYLAAFTQRGNPGVILRGPTVVQAGSIRSPSPPNSTPT